MIDFVTSLLGGETPSPQLILSLLNVEKDVVQDERPWQVLKKVDNSVVVTPSNTFTIPLPLPVDFSKFLLEGTMQLFDGNNDVQYISEVPIESQLNYKNEYGRFCANVGSGTFFLMGLIPKVYTVYLWFIQTTPDITPLTTWEKFPSRYHKLLCFGAAARYRLGTDYDDINARNADDNGKARDALLKSAERWDSDLAISAINAVDYKNDNYPGVAGSQGNSRNRWGPRGVPALN